MSDRDLVFTSQFWLERSRFAMVQFHTKSAFHLSVWRPKKVCQTCNCDVYTLYDERSSPHLARMASFGRIMLYIFHIALRPTPSRLCLRMPPNSMVLWYWCSLHTSSWFLTSWIERSSLLMLKIILPRSNIMINNIMMPSIVNYPWMSVSGLAWPIHHSMVSLIHHGKLSARPYGTPTWHAACVPLEIVRVSPIGSPNLSTYVQTGRSRQF